MPINLNPNNLVGAREYQGRPKMAVFHYDFAVDGGAVSAITLRGDAIPSGAIVTDSLLQVDTVVTSGGAATVSLGIEGAADLKAAATLSTAPALDATGAKRLTAMDADTAVVTTTAARSVVATVGTAALTAGKFRVIVTYIELAPAL